MHAQWPVNVLAAETGAKAVALLVTSEEEADALEEGAALVQELVHEKGLELLGFGCLSNPDMRWCAPLWPALCCRLQL